MNQLLQTSQQCFTDVQSKRHTGSYLSFIQINVSGFNDIIFSSLTNEYLLEGLLLKTKIRLTELLVHQTINYYFDSTNQQLEIHWISPDKVEVEPFAQAEISAIQNRIENQLTKAGFIVANVSFSVAQIAGSDQTFKHLQAQRSFYSLLGLHRKVEIYLMDSQLSNEDSISYERLPHNHTVADTANTTELVSDKKLLDYVVEDSVNSLVCEVKNKLPENCGFQEIISDYFTSPDLILQFQKGYGDTSSFFMPDFILVIDPSQNDLSASLASIAEHYEIYHTSIQDQLLHVYCGWVEGPLVETVDHVVGICHEMINDVLHTRLKDAPVSIQSIIPQLNLYV